MQNTEVKPNKLVSIQALRGLAALVVVFYHVAGYELSAGFTNPKAFLEIITQFGFAGVDLFFVISGFIITFVHWNEFGNIKYLPGFLWKRFTRIYPLYWICFIAALVLTFAFKYFKGKDVCPEYNGPLSILISFFLIKEKYNCFLPVSWTLTYELQFYLFLAVFYLVPIKMHWLTIPILVVVFSPTLFSLGITDFYISEFAIGCLIASLAKGLNLNSPF